MDVSEHQPSGIPLSFEFFPPRTEEGVIRLRQTRARLNDLLSPEYFSVTFGAGGSTRDRTFETAVEIGAEHKAPVAPHISCIGATGSAVREMLTAYAGVGIKRIVALRGDLPSGAVYQGELPHAIELVQMIRQHLGDDMHISVAAYPEKHPEASDLLTDLEYFADKVRAGANAAITQYFFNPDAYFRFLDDCRRHHIPDIPIVPGIMPITNAGQLIRFSTMCGAEIPRWLKLRLEVLADDQTALEEYGCDVVATLCERLLAGGAPGLHFYSLNKADPVLNICARLGLKAQP